MQKILKKTKVISKIHKPLVLLFVIILSSSCSLKVSRLDFDSGNILVMPPSNAVQGGRVHPVASNSGSYFQLAVVRNLDGRSSFTAKPYPSDSRFSNVEDYKIEDAIQAASKSGFKYCLVLKLGEFRDAFPMTYRDDFVTLNEAHLIDVQSKKDVWALLEPYRASGTNLGSYYPLLDEIAKKVSNSIMEKNINKEGVSYNKSYSSTDSIVNSESENQKNIKQDSTVKNIEKLEALKKAKEEGILTESEYKQKRKMIVDSL